MRVNDIFYSIQGEGHHTGRPAIFIRLSGCNLQCPFCDTDFRSFREMTDEEVAREVMLLVEGSCQNDGTSPRKAHLPMIVLTGGEPTLQPTEPLIDRLHALGFYVAMETNGTRPLPRNLDWATVSPKGKVAVERCNEVKVVFAEGTDPEPYRAIQADYYSLQPCHTGDDDTNRRITQACFSYIRRHPWWRLSLQTHILAHFK